MPADPTQSSSFDASTLKSILQSISDQLACPACLGDLRLDGERLVCAGCGRGYAIVDGIPVLIVGRENSPA
jgi:hypothetical protein